MLNVSASSVPNRQGVSLQKTLSRPVAFGSQPPTPDPTPAKPPRRSLVGRFVTGMAMLALNAVGVSLPVLAFIPFAETGRDIQQYRGRYQQAENNSQQFAKVLDRHHQAKSNFTDMLLQKTLANNPEAALKTYLSEVLPPESFERANQILKKVQETPNPTPTDYQEALNTFVREVALKNVDEPNRQRVLQEISTPREFNPRSPMQFPAYEVSQEQLDKQTFYRIMMGLSLLFFGGVAVTDLVRYPVMRKPLSALRRYFLP